MKYAILLMALLAFGLPGCEKEKHILIRGFVFDIKTNEPIDSAYVVYGIARNTIPGPIYTLYTDESGTFEVMIGEDESIRGLTVYSKHYLVEAGYETIWTKVDEHEYKYQFPMHPLDGALRMVYQNSQSENKKIYFRTATQSLLNTHGGNFGFNFPEPYPIEAAALSIDSFQVAYPSAEMVYLYWDTIPISNVPLSMPRDSFFLAQGDTLVYRVEL